MCLPHCLAERQPGWGAAGFEFLRGSLGFCVPWVPPEAGAEVHRVSVLNGELAICRAPPLTVLGTWRESAWCRGGNVGQRWHEGWQRCNPLCFPFPSIALAIVPLCLER